MSLIPYSELSWVLRKSFNVTADCFQRLSGYTHLNYMVKLSPCTDSTRSTDSESPFILKVLENGFDVNNVKMQHRLMNRLQKDGIVASQAITTPNGNPFAIYESCGNKNIIMLLTYVEGISANSVVFRKNEFENVCLKIGAYLGAIHNSLSKLGFAGSPVSSTPEWLVENALAIEDKLLLIKDAHYRDVAKRFLHMYRTNFIPVYPKLPRSYIHGDFSDTNVLLLSTGGEWNVSGIIDFEDCSYNCTVADLGICMAYFIMKAFGNGNADPIEAGKNILRGYQSIRFISNFEISVLFEIITSRIIVSYVMAHHKADKFPDKKDVLFQQAKYAPNALDVIDNAGKQYFLDLWLGSI